MNTIIIKADNKVTKVLVAILKALDVVFEVKKDKKTNEESPYDPEFVKMILERTENVKNGDYVEVNPKDIWGSLGLK
jgi:hypothetical protein